MGDFWFNEKHEVLKDLLKTLKDHLLKRLIQCQSFFWTQKILNRTFCTEIPLSLYKIIGMGVDFVNDSIRCKSERFGVCIRQSNFKTTDLIYSNNPQSPKQYHLQRNHQPEKFEWFWWKIIKDSTLYSFLSCLLFIMK